jgi:hypothetical protein
MFGTPSDYVAPEVVYHRVALFYYLLGSCRAYQWGRFLEMLWILETPVAYISLPPFEVQLIVQLGATVSEFP